MKTSWLAPLLVLAAAGVQAVETKSETKAAAGAAPSKLVCFTEPLTGSHIKKRTCVTQAEYDERKKRDQDAMMRTRSRPTVSSPAPNAPR